MNTKLVILRYHSKCFLSSLRVKICCTGFTPENVTTLNKDGRKGFSVDVSQSEYK